MVTVTLVTRGTRARPAGAREEQSRPGLWEGGHAPFSRTGVRRRGLDPRGSHPAQGIGVRKRKGLAPQGGTPKDHRRESQGRVLRGKEGLCPYCGAREWKHTSVLPPLPTREGSLLKRGWEWGLAFKLDLLRARDSRGTIPRARRQRSPPMRPPTPSEHLVDRVGVCAR